MALVQASKAGDIAAFEKLVNRYDRKLLRVAQHITHNLEDAQDAVQDTFLKAFQKLDQFQANSKFSTWLIRIVLNQSLMVLRKQRAKQQQGREVYLDHPAGEDKVPFDCSDWRPNPEQLYKASELRELLASTLQELRPGLRMVFVLRDIEGHSLQETAYELGISLAAVKTRSLRARLQVRERLSKYFRMEANWKVASGADAMCPAEPSGKPNSLCPPACGKRGLQSPTGNRQRWKHPGVAGMTRDVWIRRGQIDGSLNARHRARRKTTEPD
jgi:RNA polymerase sigma-70 factor, ECF subfamily